MNKRKTSPLAEELEQEPELNRAAAVEVDQGDVCVPPECVREVLGWLEVVDLIRASTVCRSWRSLATSPLATTSAFPGRDALYNCDLAPSSHSSSSSSSSSSASGGGYSPMWKRAYFRTWPLPQLAPPQLTPAPAPGGEPETFGHGLPELSEETAQLHAQLLAKLQLEEGEERTTALNWMALAKERLRLRCNADRTKATAIWSAQLRAYAYEEEPETTGAAGSLHKDDFERVESLAKELKRAIRTAKRQEQYIATRQAVIPNQTCRLSSELFGCLLARGTYLLNTHCKGTRKERGHIHYRSNVVAYSLTTGLPLYFTFSHTTDVSHSPEGDWTLQASLYGVPKHETDMEDYRASWERYGHTASWESRQAYTNAMLPRMLAFLFGAERVSCMSRMEADQLISTMFSHLPYLYGVHSLEGASSLAVDLPL